MKKEREAPPNPAEEQSTYRSGATGSGVVEWLRAALGVREREREETEKERR